MLGLHLIQVEGFQRFETRTTDESQLLEAGNPEFYLWA